MAHKKQAWSKRVKKERFKKKYLTRMQATRLLQLDSIHFRRLCILKGVYPRALARSKQKQSGNEKQYYLAREIKWLVRDQIAEKMMAFRAWEKKVKRAEAMNLKDDLKLLHSSRIKPQHSLVPTIKERYPYFHDAVKDIDDAMSMITLYAFLPPEVKSDTTVETHHVLTSGLHERAKEICNAWNDYVCKAKVLSKAFISIKGYYYEAIVRNERVRWLSPHEYAHKFPSGIQQYVMLSFLEFYLDLMKFVLLKLNADLKKEEEEEEKVEEEGVNTSAEDFRVPAASLEVDATQSVRAQASAISTSQSLIQTELRKVRHLFDGLSFFISREVPEKHVSLVIRACGGRVATEYIPANITHMVLDRPALPPGFDAVDHMEYIQPQYLFDCLNARLLLPVVGYRMGEELPPHVSPFTVAITNMPEDIAAVEKAKKDHPKIVSYVPQRVHEIRKMIDPSYTSVDPEGKIAALEQEFSDDEEHVAMPQMDGDDDVSLSGDELEEARRKPKWEEEEVSENVTRSKLSALKVKKQRELNLMNAPTDEVVARRRQATLRQRERQRQTESREERINRKLSDVKKQEAATKKMQLQVARKKAARYYKMVNGVVKKVEKTQDILSAKAKQLESGKLKKSADGVGLLNARVEAKKERAAAKGKKLKEKKVDNPYKKLPKWVR